MLRDGNLEIKGKFQELNSNDVLKILKDLENSFQIEDKFLKPDYFVSLPFLEGLMSLNEY